MIKKFLILFLSVLTGGIAAQTFIHKLAPTAAQSVQSIDTVKIIAVMVDFQKDNDDKTFGDGTFGSIYSQSYGDSIIDPLPHDKTYFENHLEFAKNYFSAVSNGKTTIKYFVPSEVIHLSKIMRDYSPPINSEDYSNLALLAKDVWKEAASKFNIDFSRFNMFVIFHAGVGKDVTLPGSLGLERDLPSVFLNLNSLKKYLGESFEGFDVNNFKITNTAILPETESREMETVVGKSLIQLSINGLLVANIASYLGLPDLFNTKTGNSAIGRMGLMDGQAIFAYSGLFPPEPSAWEKIKLGWETPEVIESNGLVSITTHLMAQPFANNSVVKIPINSHEYFLVENRQRDALKNGAIVTYKIGGSVFKKKFTKDVDGFQSYNADSLRGVVTNVDEFDWALPGSGLLIWHVDQNIIDSNLVTNTINANEKRKGIFVEEADGIQDIGVKFTNIFGDVLVGEGEAADFWFATNNSKYYRNEFSPFTKPNTNSNDGSRSFVALTDFSDNSDVMNFKVSFTVNNYSKYSTFQIVLPFKTTPFKARYLSACATRDSSYLIITDNLTNLSIYNLLGKRLFTSFGFSKFKPAVYSDSSKILIAGGIGNLTNVLESDDGGKHWNKYELTLKYSITLAPVIIKGNDPNLLKILIGGTSGSLSEVQFDFAQKKLSLSLTKILFDKPLIFYAGNKDYFSAASYHQVMDLYGSIFQVDSNIKIRKLAIAKKSNEYFNILLLSDGRIISVKNGKKYFERNDGATSIALGKVKNDEAIYILETTDYKINVISLSGAIVDNYPFEEPFNSKLSPYLLAFANSSHSKANILGVDSVGRILLLNSLNGEIESPFPLSLGNKPAIWPVVFNIANSGSDKNSFAFAFVDSDNRVTVIKNDGGGKADVYWGESNANATNTNFIASATEGQQSKEFFPLDEAYNWPNPVYDNKTYFHFYAGENSTVTINIFDLSGKMIAKLSKEAPANMESEIPWDVSNIQSGVYFAYLNIRGNSGKESNKIIKVVVVH